MFNDMGNNIKWVPGITIDQAEKECILQAFRFYRSNKTQTAQALGISIRTLEHKLEKYQNDEAAFETKKEEDRRNRENIHARLRGTPEPYPANGSESQNGHDKGDTETSARNGATIGVRIQPTPQTQPKHEMPMPQRREVQKVLSDSAPSVRHIKGR